MDVVPDMGIALLREQLELFYTSLNNLQAPREKVEAAVEYDTALESQLTRSDVRKIEIESQRENMINHTNVLISTISHLIGRDLTDDVRIIFPDMGNSLLLPDIVRPKTNPVNNFLQDEVAHYSIAGLQFQWQITDWNKSKIYKEMLQLKAAKLQNAETLFIESHAHRDCKWLDNKLGIIYKR